MKIQKYLLFIIYSQLLNAQTVNYSTKEWLLNDIKHSVYFNLNKVNATYKSDKEVIFEALKSNSSNFQFIDKKLQKDKDFLQEALKKGYGLEYAPIEMRQNRELMFAYIQNTSAYSIDYSLIDKSLWSDKIFVLKVLSFKDDTDILKSMNQELKKDKSFAIELLKIQGYYFKYLDDVLQNNKEIAQLALDKDESNIAYIYDNFQKNKDILELIIIPFYTT